jgi:hypothetical protein
MSLSDGTVANPESAGLRSEPLRDLVEWLDDYGQANIHSLLVVRHGRLLFEHYRAGEPKQTSAKPCSCSTGCSSFSRMMATGRAAVMTTETAATASSALFCI